MNDHKSDITRMTKLSKKTYKSGRSDKSTRSLEKKLKSRERFEIEKTAEDMLRRIDQRDIDEIQAEYEFDSGEESIYNSYM